MGWRLAADARVSALSDKFIGENMEVIDFMKAYREKKGGWTPTVLAHELMWELAHDKSVMNCEMHEFCEVMEGYIKVIKEELNKAHS
jgi:hypothetical protein